MVVFAMVAARRAPDVLPARIRIPSWGVWEVAGFVLNVLAFILVGSQLRSIAARATGAVGARYAAVAAAVCLAVILARIAWVTGAAALRPRRPCNAAARRPDLAVSPLLAAGVGPAFAQSVPPRPKPEDPLLALVESQKRDEIKDRT